MTALNSEIRSWGNARLSDFQHRLFEQGIGVEGDLSASLAARYGYDYGDIDRISYKMLRYGVFVELGVGRGYPIESVRSNRGRLTGGRRPKPWFNPVLDEQLPVLADKVAEHNADMVVNSLKIGQGGK